MSIGETFSRLLLKQLVDDVFITGGVEALDVVIDFLTRCGQQNDPGLMAALEHAMHRAWRALEAALTDEPSRDHSQAGLTPRDAQALRQCLARVLDELAHGGTATGPAAAMLVSDGLRHQCLDDLRSARTGGALAGCLDSEEWARSNEVFVRFAAQQGRRETRRRTEGQLLRELEQQGCVGLMRILTTGAGLPLLLMAARAFACQELAHLLYRCLQECPEQTPDNCTLVLDILHELCTPRFSVWRAPAVPTMPVHWSRLDAGPCVKPLGRLRGRRPGNPSAKRRSPRNPSRNRPILWQTFTRGRLPRCAAETSRASWAAASVLVIAVALLVVLPIWMLVEKTQRHDPQRQRIIVEQERLREERRRIGAERQRLIETQQRIAREERARQNELQSQREEAERRRRMEAEEERRQTEERTVKRREEQRRRLADERQALLREKQQRFERARVALEDGLWHAAHGEDREALTSLSEALMLDPSLHRGWSERGEVRRRLGDIAGALRDFHEAVRHDPDDVRCWFQCGELYRSRHEFRQAIDAFTDVLRLEPDNAEAYRQRGLCHAGAGEVEQALADQTKAIDLAPTDPWAYYYRANLRRLRNRLDRAFEDYTSAINRDRVHSRGLAGAYRGRGMLLLHWHNYEQAIPDLTQALERDPTDTAALRARGMAYLRSGDWDKALLDLEGVIRHDAGDGTAYKLRGQAYLGLRDYRRAQEDFTRASWGDRDAEAFYLRARVKVSLGDLQEAIFDCNSATAIDPHLARAFYLRGKLNLRAGHRVRGLADCRTAHELDPLFPLP